MLLLFGIILTKQNEKFDHSIYDDHSKLVLYGSLDATICSHTIHVPAISDYICEENR